MLFAEREEDMTENDYFRTQEEIIRFISLIPSEKEVGGKYLGDCVCRIFMDFIGKELPENCNGEGEGQAWHYGI